VKDSNSIEIGNAVPTVGNVFGSFRFRCLSAKKN